MKFKDSLLQEQIDAIGFVKVPLLNAEEVKDIKQYLLGQTPLEEMTKQYGFTSAVWISNSDTKTHLDAKVRGIVHAKLSTILEDFKALIYSAIGKGIGEKSELSLHQDWSVVDEEKDYSLSLWIPLSDSTLENGAIHFLEGSHKTHPSIRCGSVSHEYGDPETIINQMNCVEVKAGEALIFYSRVLHYTPNNYSNQMRFAVISCLVSETAEIVQYYKVSDTQLEVYKMEETFYNKYDNFLEQIDQKPNGIKIGEVAYVPFKSLI